MDDAKVKKTVKQLEQLRAVLPARGRVLILPHDHPDPDALASAAALHLLLHERFGLNGQIVFTGLVARAENQEMLRHFRYRWRHPGELRAPSKKIPTIFVDTAPWTGNVTIPSYAEPVAVIDHHPIRKMAAPMVAFADIRQGAGATATILNQYLDAVGVAPPKWLATLLTYAIITETLDLSRDSGPEDLEAYVDLLTRSNLKVLGKIRHAPLTREYFSHMKEAMDNGQVFGRVAFTHLHGVEQTEIVAELADFLLRMERISWAFCTAYREDRLVVSLRSSAAGARCGQLLRRLIGRSGEAGGHHHMAAGFIAMKSLKPSTREVKRNEFVQGLLRRIERRTRSQSSLGSSPLAPQPLVMAAPVQENQAGGKSKPDAG